MNSLNPKVDEFLSKAKKWQEEMKQLRRIVLDCGLTEALKWGVPCYTFQESNIVIIGSFKAYCALSFFKGVLLKDAQKNLEKPGENTQSARLIRFSKVQEIVEKEGLLKAYINEAIEVEKAGLKVDFLKSSAFLIPEELQHKFNKNPDLKAAFYALTPGRQRGYILHFSAPKHSKTREARIEKYIQQILNGKGFHDCTCGLSKKQPYCDGSHNSIR